MDSGTRIISAGGGGVAFSNEVVVVEGDDTITIRQMNMDGTVYHSSDHITAEYNDDSISIVELDQQSNNTLIDDDNGMTFLDAMEENTNFDHNEYVGCFVCMVDCAFVCYGTFKAYMTSRLHVLNSNLIALHLSIDFIFIKDHGHIHEYGFCD